MKALLAAAIIAALLGGSLYTYVSHDLASFVIGGITR